MQPTDSNGTGNGHYTNGNGNGHGYATANLETPKLQTIEKCEHSDPMEPHFKKIIEHIGEDAEREGLLKTPKRVSKAMRFLTKGYTEDLDTLINEAIFHEDDNEMVILKDIEFYSLCEHHMLPFVGKAHVAYIPDGKVIGVSKLARIVDHFARRLQVQERITKQVAEALMEKLQPKGVGVVMEGAHMCMQMRGVQKQGSSMMTSAMLGEFRENLATREEFLSLIRSR